jgi:hypothetical protein
MDIYSLQLGIDRLNDGKYCVMTENVASRSLISKGTKRIKYAADPGHQQCPLHDGMAAYGESEQYLLLAAYGREPPLDPLCHAERRTVGPGMSGFVV